MVDKRLDTDFYLQDDVVTAARNLIGKVLHTHFTEGHTAGLIVETEAYAGVNDRASHAFGGKITARNHVMYHTGGVAYVYLCYGIHHLFNVVTNVQGVPHAVLIRAMEPLHGVGIMEKRRNRPFVPGKAFSGGPGTLSQALGIKTLHSGESLMGQEIWIENSELKIAAERIIAGPRIGVDYAGEDALLPYRFKLDKMS